jgi:hypothetical protein
MRPAPLPQVCRGQKSTLNVGRINLIVRRKGRAAKAAKNVFFVRATTLGIAAKNKPTEKKRNAMTGGVP